MNEINFYSTTTNYNWLSNFCFSPMVIDGVKYPTNEHYYQSQKFKDTNLRMWIVLSPSPKYIYLLTRIIKKDEIREDWEQVKFDVMLNGLREKFKQNKALRDDLIATGNSLLCEDSSDKVWGKRGQNMLGKLLMKVRDELNETRK